MYLHIFTSLNLTKLSLSVRRKKVAEKFKKAIMQKRSRSGSSIWLERRPVTAEVASSSLVRIAMILKYEQPNNTFTSQSFDCWRYL